MLGKGKQYFVLLHGWISSSDVFHDFAEAFLNDYTVILIDWRGHGDSSYNSPTRNGNDIALDIALLLQLLGVTETFVGGWSTGGVLAL
jgi:pimeloyl-ACP methyl ester carboxylesterase